MKKILVAYDGDQPSHRALETAADLAKHYQAELGVVSVVPVHAGRVPIDPWDDAAVHKAELAEARSILVGFGIEPAVYEVAGEPAAAIEKVAIEQGYDTIVVGSRGLGLLSRMLQGSVSEHLATHARTTVVIAH